MNLSYACDAPVQPPIAERDRGHPRFGEYLKLRAAFDRQLVTAPPFATWLAQTEAFERARTNVFEVVARDAELEPGWYVHFFQPRCHEPERFGPYSTQARAQETEQWLKGR